MNHELLIINNKLQTANYQLYSTNVECSLQITPFYAKRTQILKKSNERNYLSNNELRTTNYELRSKKQSQFKPNTKPIQTQNEPKTNPMQSQFKPNLSRRSLWRSRIKSNLEKAPKPDFSRTITHQPD